MAAYKDIDGFIREAFPVEFEKILHTQARKTTIEEFVEKTDNEFAEKLKAITAVAETDRKTEAKAAP
jgi:hypothetical protein